MAYNNAGTPGPSHYGGGTFYTSSAPQQPNYNQPQINQPQYQPQSQSTMFRTLQPGANQYGQSSSIVPSSSQPSLQPNQYDLAAKIPTMQTGQSVQKPDRDEDPQYGPLGRAAQRVQRARQTDAELTVDLQDALASVKVDSRKYLAIAV